MQEFRIDGVVNTPSDMTEEEFQDLFLEWVESNGFMFGGNSGSAVTDIKNNSSAEVELDDPTMIVGSWYYYTHDTGEGIFRYKSKRPLGGYFASEAYIIDSYKYFEANLDVYFCDSCITPTLATTDQMERILTIVAKDKGFEMGVTYYCLPVAAESTIYTLNDIEVVYNIDLDTFGFQGCGWIYNKGRWAEVIVKDEDPKDDEFGCLDLPDVIIQA